MVEVIPRNWVIRHEGKGSFISVRYMERRVAKVRHRKCTTVDDFKFEVADRQVDK